MYLATMAEDCNARVECIQHGEDAALHWTEPVSEYKPLQYIPYPSILPSLHLLPSTTTIYCYWLPWCIYFDTFLLLFSITLWLINYDSPLAIQRGCTVTNCPTCLLLPDFSTLCRFSFMNSQDCLEGIKLYHFHSITLDVWKNWDIFWIKILNIFIYNVLLAPI